jgi:hypothetical protein
MAFVIVETSRMKIAANCGGASKIKAAPLVERRFRQTIQRTLFPPRPLRKAAANAR